MPEQMTKADSLRLYLSGAGSDGGAQADPDAALGNYRSSTRFQALGIQGAAPRIAVLYASGANGLGTGSLESDGAGNLRWTAPGSSTPGDYVAIADTETKLLEDGDDPDKHVLVSRSGDAPEAGAWSIPLTEVYNGLWDNVATAHAVAGASEYRALFFKNDSAKDLYELKAWLATLGTRRASNTAQLGAAGAGTLGTNAGSKFGDWPSSGFARILDSGGSLREIVYYASRTDGVLTVAAGGRGLLGTSAGAGAADDTLDAVPGLALAKEAPSAQPSGFIQTIASETTAPTGVTWQTGISSGDADAVNIGTLRAGEIYGLWLHRQVAPQTRPSPLVRAALRWSFKTQD